jgi:putative sigma-54 modulation protein
MNVNVHLSHDIPDTVELREHIDRRLGFALGKFGDKVNQIAIHLTDQNGPKGGIDVRCKIHVQLHPQGSLLIEQDESSPEHAVDSAVHRLGQAIRRELDRQRDSRVFLAH